MLTKTVDFASNILKNKFHLKSASPAELPKGLKESASSDSDTHLPNST